jgi:hypothetical protein
MLRRKCCFVVGQVPSLCGDADNARHSDWPLPNWAGGTTGFLATPLLLCTATSRGKDDHHRGPIPHAGGEICFWWSEFWTGTKQNRGRRIFQGYLARPDSQRSSSLWAPPSIAALGVVNHHVLGDGKYAGLPLELDPIGGVGCELHLPGLGPQPRDDITNRTASTKLCQQ